jgi:hypothetical protein
MLTIALEVKDKTLETAKESLRAEAAAGGATEEAAVPLKASKCNDLALEIQTEAIYNHLHLQNTI